MRLTPQAVGRSAEITRTRPGPLASIASGGGLRLQDEHQTALRTVRHG